MSPQSGNRGGRNANRAAIHLNGGRSFEGFGFGARAMAGGELVFTTAMTGYTEALTDPSFSGQVLVFTNPLIGNYGFEQRRMESGRIHAAGMVIAEQSRIFSNFRARESLHSALRSAGVPGIEGVDTRAITILLRTEGCQNGLIAPMSAAPSARSKKFDDLPDMSGLDLSERVTTRTARWFRAKRRGGLKVALLDFGVKRNILNEILARGASVLQLPAGTPAQDILECGVDGLLLSNGPGDPGSMTGVYTRIRALIGRMPIFGICLGHQLLGLAAGLQTYKLKFGHRGTNHPVQDLRGRSIAITTQNHGFSVREPAKSARGVRVTHRSLYDGTVEGLDLPGKNAFAVQFHPESTPGPRDSMELFDRFLSNCRNGRR